MTAAALLDEARAAGLAIRAEGDTLRVGPPDRLSAELREKLQALKPELLSLLAARQESAGAAWAAAFLRLRAVGWPGEASVAAKRPDLHKVILAAEAEAERLTAAYRAGAVDVAAFLAALDGWEASIRVAARELGRICSDCGDAAVAALADPSTGERFCVRCAHPGRMGARP